MKPYTTRRPGASETTHIPARTPGSREREWVFIEGIRLTFGKIRDGWSDLPRAIRRAWLRTMGIGLLLTALLVVALTRAGRRLEEREVLGWERDFFLRFDDEFPMSFYSALFAGELGSSVLLVPLTFLVAAAAAWLGKPLHALAALSAYFGIKPLVYLGWMLWERPRPTLIADGLAAPGLHSYPSGHVANAVTILGFVVFLWIRSSTRRSERIFAALLLLGVVTLVGLARLRIGAHWPSDIVAGLLLGAAWLAVVIVALRRAEAVLGADLGV